MQQTAMDLVTLLGGGAAIVLAAVGAAYWCFKLFSEKWLAARFNERLEDYRHKQQRQLEELRFKINALMDRTTKLHQREFDVLPEAWSRLVMAHGHVQAVTTGLQQYPDLDRMTSAELVEFLEKTPLESWKKEEIKAATKKSDRYIRAINFHKAWEARNTYRDYYTYFQKNSIFIRREIKSRFDAISELTHGALVEHEIGLQHGNDFRNWETREKFSKESGNLLASLEAEVQTRLWDSQSANLGT